MSSYHLSLLRSRGWLRAGLVAAFLAFPVTSIGFGLGYFGDDWRGMIQALEFAGGGIVLSLTIGLSAPWVLRGFAVRAREEDESRDSEKPASRPASGAAAAARHGAPSTPGGRH
ncbi:MAG: hypothetical protein F8N37_12550 [Telmatospirillum sp.]|nr:hypothetical protein [Telmatospirillum sp.]